ncbi:hypothetical protein [Flavobacterium sp. B183]|uniref:hypothetical protein n=1 Tax=Flavobacterium sp. B183 TaxID=907046 RepID=UPI00201F5A53|nr:hypothetical protein [Flavobacterium sp. B183]URC11440.1 hypothetical protein M4I44_15200 [Flavobacterium sp. B183]
MIDLLDKNGYFEFDYNGEKFLGDVQKPKSFCFMGNYLEKVTIDVIINLGEYKSGVRANTEELTIISPNIPADIKFWIDAYFTHRPSLSRYNFQCDKPL